MRPALVTFERSRAGRLGGGDPTAVAGRLAGSDTGDGAEAGAEVTNPVTKAGVTPGTDLAVARGTKPFSDSVDAVDHTPTHFSSSGQVNRDALMRERFELESLKFFWIRSAIVLTVTLGVNSG